jgi:hypothetical protein
MKRSILWTLFFVAMLSLSLVAAAKDKEKIDCYKCSARKVAGTWGYSETGTMIFPGPTPVLYASVGSYTIDRHGNISGERTASAGGTILRATIEGTAIVNPDCTGTLMLNFFDLLGNEAGTAEKYVVYVDSAREANMIITHVSHPVYGDLSAILTTNAKKLSPGHGNECGK